MALRALMHFDRDCCDKDTIYMKLDDDVVWFEPELFEKMVEVSCG